MARPITTTLKILAPAVGILAIVAVVSVANGVSMPYITRDVAAIAKLHPLAGALSSLGAFLWCAAAAVSLFAAYLLKSTKNADARKFLAWSAGLSLYLLADDFFQIHEDLANRYLHMDEKFLMTALGVSVLYYLVRYRSVVMQTRYGLLVASIFLLAASVLIDTVLEQILWRLGHWTFFIEDGLKWLGITAWCGFHCNAAHTLVLSAEDVYAGIQEHDPAVIGSSRPVELLPIEVVKA